MDRCFWGCMNTGCGPGWVGRGREDAAYACGDEQPRQTGTSGSIHNQLVEDIPRSNTQFIIPRPLGLCITKKTHECHVDSSTWLNQQLKHAQL